MDPRKQVKLCRERLVEMTRDRDRWKARADAAEHNFHSTLDHIRSRGDWVRFNDHCTPPIPYTVTR